MPAQPSRSPGSIHLGRIAGVPIGLHWSLLVIGTLLGVSLAGGNLESQFPGYGSDTYALTAAVGVVLFFAAVLAHEIAHALAARRFGVDTEGIELWILGGVARLTAEPPTPRADATIAAAGPAASLVAAGLFLATGYLLDLSDAPGLLAPMLGWLGVVNIVLAVFNLLPASPLDGGRILRAALWARSDDRDSAGITAAKVGKVLGFAIALGGFWLVLIGQAGLMTMVVGWFILSNAKVEAKVLSTRKALRGRSVRDLTSFGVARAADWTDAGTMLSQRDRLGQPGVVAVVGFGGALEGLVTEAQMQMIPPALRPRTTLAQLAIGLDRLPRADLDDDLIEVLDRSDATAGLITVWDDGELVGVVRPERLRGPG